MGIRGIPHIGPDQFSRLLDTNRQTNTKTNKKQTSKFVFRQINSIQVLSISKKKCSTAYLTHLRSIVCFIFINCQYYFPIGFIDNIDKDVYEDRKRTIAKLSSSNISGVQKNSFLKPSFIFSFFFDGCILYNVKCILFSVHTLV